MKRYIAFLRNVNISGENRVPMTELKKEFEGKFKHSVRFFGGGTAIRLHRHSI